MIGYRHPLGIRGADSGLTKSDSRKGIQLVVDEERGEELEANHQYVGTDHPCGPAAWRVSWD